MKASSQQLTRSGRSSRRIDHSGSYSRSIALVVFRPYSRHLRPRGRPTPLIFQPTHVVDPIIRSQPWVERDALHETLYPGKTTRGLRAAGLSYRAIAGELTRLGPVNRAGGRFNHTQVVRMLEEAA